MEQTPSLFISSTVEDLRSCRTACLDAAMHAGFMPVMQEYFTAQSAYPPLEACLRKVDECNVIAVVVAHRHGWTPADQPPVDGKPGVKSITRLECERAVQRGKEVLAFLIDPSHPWPMELQEAGRLSVAMQKGEFTTALAEEVQRNMESLSDFKQWLESRGTVLPERRG